MNTRFSPSTRNFYPFDIDYSALPDDVVEVPAGDFAAATQRAPGETLALVDGRVVIVPAQPLADVIPATITMRQARLALLSAGKLSGVSAAIDALPSPQRDVARIEWEFASVVERQSPIVSLLGPALGMSEAELDTLFKNAATL